MFDLVIRNGTVIDGTGAAGRRADVAIKDGIIVEVADTIDGDAVECYDAAGQVVSPGFIDIHTHYDGQVTWDDKILPSSAHGVTTAIAGACGIGFAPVRRGAEDWLVGITEGVEDIPGTALHAGVPWGWETFEEYLDFVGGRSYALDVAFHVPHSAVRAYVLGDKALEDGPATDEELDQILDIVRSGIEAGAIGFATSRMSLHRNSDGTTVPGTRAPRDELMAIARAVRDAGGGVMQMLPSGGAGGVEGQPGEAMRSGLAQRDQHTLSSEVEMMLRIHRETGLPVTFTLSDNRNVGDEELDRVRDLIAAARENGELVHPQYAPRPIGGLVSLDTYHPFMARPSYAAIADLPLAERAARMADPELRAQILGENDQEVGSDDPRKHTHQTLQRHLEDIYVLEDGDYEPDPARSMAAIAGSTGRDALEVTYDHLVADGGRAILIWLATGYHHGNLDRVGTYISDPQYTVGLGDGGAHVLFICDASFTTFLLTHWGRDRTRGATFPVEELVRRLTGDHAELYGLSDRGRIEVGLRADLNVIDMERLSVGRPYLTDDLPNGAERFLQDAAGYRLTVVDGTVVRRDDADTGARPGRLVRRAALGGRRADAPGVSA